MKVKQSKDYWRHNKLKRFCWVLIIIFFIFGTEAFSKEWNGIVPCVSTRSDVGEILGKDSFPSPDMFGSYRYKKFRVSVYYDRKDKNNPDKNVVEKIHVYPEKTETLKKYIKNIPNFYKDFRKTELDDRITHVRGLAVYINLKEGFEIWVQKNEDDMEEITRFGYFAPYYSCKKQNSSQKPTQPERN